MCIASVSKWICGSSLRRISSAPVKNCQDAIEEWKHGLSNHRTCTCTCPHICLCTHVPMQFVHVRFSERMAKMIDYISRVSFPLSFIFFELSMSGRLWICRTKHAGKMAARCKTGSYLCMYFKGAACTRPRQWVRCLVICY